MLDHELTRWDMKQKDNNIYRLGLLLEANGKVRYDIVNIGWQTDEIMTRSVAEIMIQSLGPRFEPGFSPVNKTVKQITQFLATGKRPTLK